MGAQSLPHGAHPNQWALAQLGTAPILAESVLDALDESRRVNGVHLEVPERVLACVEGTGAPLLNLIELAPHPLEHGEDLFLKTHVFEGELGPANQPVGGLQILVAEPAAGRRSPNAQNP